MSAISEFINAIRNAVYGEQVRGAIKKIVVGSALNSSFKLPNKIRELKMVVID